MGGGSRIFPEDDWRAYMEGTHRNIHRMKRTLGWLPTDPRCRFCHVPFAGAGGWVARRVSKSNLPWEKNPNLCRRCVIETSKGQVVGAEVPASFLFADVRGSSGLARRLGDRAFTEVMQRFYEVSTRTLWDHDALLDKFVGDEVVGFFVPFMAGRRHAVVAIEAARALFRAVGYGTEPGPWLSLGAGVNTGPSFIGYVSRGLDSEFTAMGNTINVAAHLAAQARAGEILITEEVRAALGAQGLDRRRLSLKGHEVDAYAIDVLGAPSG